MQQFSAKTRLATLQLPAVLAALTCLVAGCQREQVQSYSVPKESSPPATPPKVASADMASPQPLQWKTPAGWEELPASGMRVGSFAVNKEGQKVDISIIPLAVISGSEVENVNRWRGQVGLAPIDSAALAGAAEKVSAGNMTTSVYDMVGTDPQSKQPTRIVAAIIPVEGTTWFFKMVGPEKMVAEQKEAFKQLLASVQFGATPAGAPPTEVASAPRPVSTNVKEMPGSAKTDKPTWVVPTGWQEQAATSMRLASFMVSGEGSAKADVSVIKLSGMAGGILANVNRWRSQIGLQPVDEAALQKLVTSRDIGGVQVTFVDMVGRSVESGDPARLLAAIVPRAEGTWFYKMLGNDALVAQQRQAFDQFVETARYPHAL